MGSCRHRTDPPQPRHRRGADAPGRRPLRDRSGRRGARRSGWHGGFGSHTRDRALLIGWPALRSSALKPIILSGAGQWLGSLGWQLASASDAVVLAYLGYRELVPVFVVTSRLGLTLMQLSWTLPDSTSVGLAQLKAEGQEQRTTEVIRSLLQFHLLAAGLVACGCLAANFGFVSAWVGQDLYGGASLNATIALGVVALSVVHGLVVPVAVLGRRMTTGLVTLLNGAVHVVLAVAFGRVWGRPAWPLRPRPPLSRTVSPSSKRWFRRKRSRRQCNERSPSRRIRSGTPSHHRRID